MDASTSLAFEDLKLLCEKLEVEAQYKEEYEKVTSQLAFIEKEWQMLLSQDMSEENARKICLEKGYIQEYEAGKRFLETRNREQTAKIHSLEISRAQLEKKLDMKEPIANSVSAIHRVKFAVSLAFQYSTIHSILV